MPKSIDSFPWGRAIVVGASSGIGEHLARQLGASGVAVALVGRRADRLQALCDEINRDAPSELAFPVVHDVRSTTELAPLFQEITGRLGGLDLIVYVAGLMPRIGPQQYSTEVDREIIETNLTGAVAWINQAADRFLRAGEGTIVGISSVAGDRGRRANPVYSATKAGLNTYLESLRNRLAVKGVTIVTVKPGYVDTALIEGLKLPGVLPAISPEEAARQILSGAAARKGTVYVPPWWRYVMLIVRTVPSTLMRRLNF